MISIAHINSQRLVRLVNDILDIEKLESGQTVFNLERVDVRQQVGKAIEANPGFAEARDVRILFDRNAGVDADVRGRSGSACAGDCQSAVERHKILSAEWCGGSGGREGTGDVRISVRDHGPGIAADFKPRIFERFAQADVNDARLQGGTGLGLSIVKEIVDRLGGRVNFADVPGGGRSSTSICRAGRTRPAVSSIRTRKWMP